MKTLIILVLIFCVLDASWTEDLFSLDKWFKNPKAAARSPPPLPSTPFVPRSGYCEDMSVRSIHRDFTPNFHLYRDLVLYGFCKNKPGIIDKSVIRAGLKCSRNPNYTCYSLCHMKQLGLIDPYGGLDEKKQADFINDRWEDMEESVRKSLRDISKRCYKDELKSATFPECTNRANEDTLGSYFDCMIKGFYKTCKGELKVDKDDVPRVSDESLDKQSIEQARKHYF